MIHIKIGNCDVNVLHEDVGERKQAFTMIKKCLLLERITFFRKKNKVNEKEKYVPRIVNFYFEGAGNAAFLQTSMIALNKSGGGGVRPRKVGGRWAFSRPLLLWSLIKVVL